MVDTPVNSDVSISNAMNGINGQLQENVAAPVDQQQQQPQGFSGWAMFKTMLFRMLVIYLITSFLRRPSQPANNSLSTQTVIAATNVLPKDALLDLFIYISESNEPIKDFLHPFWLHEGLMYGDYTEGPTQDGVYTISGTIPISEKVQNNGSLFIHTYFVQSGFSPDPKSGDNYSKRHTIYKSKQLNKFKKRKYHTMKNLLTGTTAVQPDLVRMTNETTIEILSHWHPNLTINLVYDHTEWVNDKLPQPFDEYIEFLQGGLEYYPIVYFNDYWNLNSEYMPINNSVSELNLTLSFYHMSILKWQMYAAQGMQRGWYSYLGEDMAESNDEDQDNLKQTILETNPYLLALTIVVSLVHSVFEFLAFKNDIQFWRNRTTLEGLSVRSVFFNVFQSVIILLYVLDNDTNFIIRVSIFVGLLIEMWKIHKVVDIKLDRENRLFNIIPRIVFTDKSTYTQSHTKEYDMLAFKYLSILLFPLLVGYAVYSVLYQEHKGWYSWVLSMLYGFLLTFGFIAMTPQLFINYKLKSVAHLPWRMLTYKALNTFIDDLFAFVIKMPMLYRIGCFRDDIVFLIYVYQRWIYRVDPKRMNEFGTCGVSTIESEPLAVANLEEDVVNHEESEISENKDSNEKKND